MNILEALKRLFMPSSSIAKGEDIGLYYYVKSNKTGSIVRVRINPMNDLTQTDNEDGFYTHKVIHGTRGYDPMDATFHYSKDRKFVNADIEGGQLVEREEYEAYSTAQGT